MKAQRIDHVGINVTDLAAARTFFLDLGFEVQGEGEVEGAWVDRVVGLENVKSAIVMMGVPGGQTNIELVQFYTPAAEGSIQPLPANTLGIRHIAVVVDDLETVIARLREKGMETFSEIQEYGGQYKLIYVRGPEGIILELAEQLS